MDRWQTFDTLDAMLEELQISADDIKIELNHFFRRLESYAQEVSDFPIHALIGLVACIQATQDACASSLDKLAEYSSEYLDYDIFD